MNHRTLVSQKILLPNAFESVAISYKPKLAALCYDRIWSPDNNHQNVPDSIRCFGRTDIEQQITVTQNFGDVMQNMMSHLPPEKTGQQTNDQFSDISIDQISKNVADFLCKFPTGHDGDSILYFTEVAKAFRRELGIAMVTIYDSPVDWQNEYHNGDNLAIVVNIKDVPIPLEDKLTWKQVMEFRNDKQSLEKYRNFMYWLNKDFIAQSGKSIKEQLSMKLSEYTQCLKKHGINTVQGAISQVIDQKFMLGSAWARLGRDLCRHPIFNLLSNGIAISGKTVLKTGYVYLNLNDIDRGFASEISWVYQTS